MRENNSAHPAKTAQTIKIFAPALLTLALIASPFARSQKSTLVKPLAPYTQLQTDLSCAPVAPRY